MSILPGNAPTAGLFDVNKIKALCALPDVTAVLTMAFIVSIPLGIHQGITGLILIEYFQLTAIQSGYFAAFVGTTVVVSIITVGCLAKDTLVT